MEVVSLHGFVWSILHGFASSQERIQLMQLGWSIAEDREGEDSDTDMEQVTNPKEVEGGIT